MLISIRPPFLGRPLFFEPQQVLRELFAVIMCPLLPEISSTKTILPMKPLLLACLYILFSPLCYTQCISTGFVNGTTFATDNSTGSYDFSVPSNAQTSDNIRTSAASLISVLSANTYYLKITGFNFSIPAASSICGVSVEVESRATGVILTAAVKDNEVRLVKGGVITGNNYAKAADWPSSDGVTSYGGTSDLWGTTLTPADVNSSGFGIAISARIIALVAALPSADIDNIRLKITYNPLLPVHLLSFSAQNAGKKIVLKWRTADEEENGSITLQRSAGNTGQWQDIHYYDQHAGHTIMNYEYEDIPREEGLYNYRLQLIASSGMRTFSNIQTSRYEISNELLIYPVPAADFIYVHSTDALAGISIIDITGKIYKPQIVNVTDHSFKVDTRMLPKGIYIIQLRNKSARFIKV